ncbi:hypothetical protein [Legionella sp. CNM-4043-24]|uniref:hypothetical protein n=1 Tax=Legionella sp. CNM-4043-24 TaxID=3421646 RepID=UPI00403AEA0A
MFRAPKSTEATSKYAGIISEMRDKTKEFEDALRNADILHSQPDSHHFSPEERNSVEVGHNNFYSRATVIKFIDGLKRRIAILEAIISEESISSEDHAFLIMAPTFKEDKHISEYPNISSGPKP